MEVLGGSLPQTPFRRFRKHPRYPVGAIGIPTLFKGEIMEVCDQIVWNSYIANPSFRRYLEVCRNFDPKGFERALKEDEAAYSFDFRRVIIEAYMEDLGAGVVR